MRHKIEIEIDVDGFQPLYEVGDDDSTLTDTVCYTEQNFVDDLRRILSDKLEDWDIVGDHFDTWPDDWEYLPDCCRGLEIKVNGRTLILGRRDCEKKVGK